MVKKNILLVLILTIGIMVTGCSNQNDRHTSVRSIDDLVSDISKGGSSAYTAKRNLIARGDSVLPRLLSRYLQENDGGTRMELVEVAKEIDVEKSRLFAIHQLRSEVNVYTIRGFQILSNLPNSDEQVDEIIRIITSGSDVSEDTISAYCMYLGVQRPRTTTRQQLEIIINNHSYKDARLFAAVGLSRYKTKTALTVLVHFASEGAPNNRLLAISCFENYSSDVAVPLLKRFVNDKDINVSELSKGSLRRLKDCK